MVSRRCRLVGSFLLYHHERHVNELAGYAREGDVVMFPVLALLSAIVVSEVGVILPGTDGSLRESPSQRSGPAFRHVPAGSYGLAGLVSRGVHVGISHELARIADLSFSCVTEARATSMPRMAMSHLSLVCSSRQDSSLPTSLI